MKEVKVEKTVETTEWEAFDGTTFTDRDACRQYESNSMYEEHRAFEKRGITLRTPFSDWACELSVWCISVESLEDYDRLIRCISYGRDVLDFYEPESYPETVLIAESAMDVMTFSPREARLIAKEYLEAYQDLLIAFGKEEEK